jgi:hypothetical protein
MNIGGIDRLFFGLHLLSKACMTFRANGAMVCARRCRSFRLEENVAKTIANIIEIKSSTFIALECWVLILIAR